jgi:3-oxoacyl-[acyl-carrier-protein] synthase-3
VRISGTGSYLPSRVVTNEEFSRTIDTNDEWIASRTGIRERHFAAPGETTSDMATAASRRALEQAGITAKDLDLIICATMTPDHSIPCTAGLVQRGLGADRAGGYDLSAACSGFVIGLSVASAYIKSGMAKNVLVVGAEKMTTVIDPLDRGTAVIFADGAGAAVVQTDPTGASDVLATRHGLRGDDDVLVVPAGGSKKPLTAELIEKRENYVRMKGRETYKFAVSTFGELIEGTCKDAGVTTKDISIFVPHQVNLRILEAASERFGIPLDRVVINIDRIGNTSAASVGIALDEAVRAGRVKRGDIMLMVAFGAGLTWASALIRW